MFLCLLYIAINLVRANGNEFSDLLYKKYFKRLPAEHPFLARKNTPEDGFIDSDTCDFFEKTHLSPFVAILLYKTSGNFLGMGGIINSRTVLTSEEAVKVAFDDPRLILVLAGYKTAWWGRNSQVRKGYQTFFNEHELVLLEVEPHFKFNKRIQPIRIARIPEMPITMYENNFLLFGIPTPSDFYSGDVIPKSVPYVISKHILTGDDGCEKEYSYVKPRFDKSVHECVIAEDALCSGCVGSPVLAVQKNTPGVVLVGVVIKSDCFLQRRRVLVLKLSKYVEWIKTGSAQGVFE